MYLIATPKSERMFHDNVKKFTKDIINEKFEKWQNIRGKTRDKRRH